MFRNSDRLPVICVIRILFSDSQLPETIPAISPEHLILIDIKMVVQRNAIGRIVQLRLKRLLQIQIRNRVDPEGFHGLHGGFFLPVISLPAFLFTCGHFFSGTARTAAAVPSGKYQRHGKNGNCRQQYKGCRIAGLILFVGKKVIKPFLHCFSPR